MKYLITIWILFFLIIIWVFYEKNFDNEKKDTPINQISKKILKEIEKQNKEGKIIIENSNELNPEEIKEKIKIQKAEDLNNKTNGKSELLLEKPNNNSENKIEKEIELLENPDILDINISGLNYSSNNNNIIKINWGNFNDIEYVNIWEYKFKPQLIDWFLYILIEENNYLDWKYNINFILKNWDTLKYDKQINFSLSKSSLLVTDITPKLLRNDINRNIVLQWKWFSKIISIQLSNNIVLKDTSFKIINDKVMSILIPKDLNPWSYNLNILYTDWIYKPNINIDIKK